MRRLARQLFQLFSPSKTKAPIARKRPPSLRLQLEALEDRCVLSSLATVYPATLSGTAFIDPNHDNTFDAGDTLLGGATVTLTGLTNNVSVSTVTDASGSYKFMQVAPGTYQISLSTNGVFLSGGADAGNLGGIVSGTSISAVTISEGQTLVNYNLAVNGLAAISRRLFLSDTITVNAIPSYTVVPPPLMAGSGLVYADGAAPPANLTSSGPAALTGSVMTTDAVPVPVAGVTIGLYGMTGPGANAGLPFNQTTTTTVTGDFTFTNLPAGSYAIAILDNAAGFRADLPTLGTLGGIITANDIITGIDIASTSASGYIFKDTAVPGAAGNLEAHLSNDTTGPVGTGTASDGITSDPSVAGLVLDTTGVTGLIATLDGAALNITYNLNPDGTFFVNRAVFNQLAGGVLADGAHTLHLDVLGGSGGSADINFTLQSVAPLQPSLDLAAANDSGTLGDRRTTNAVLGAGGAATLNGVTSAGAHVDLFFANTTQSVVADGSGNFSFNVNLTNGANDMTVRATDQAGNQSEFKTLFVVDQAPTTTNIPNVTVTNGAANQVLDMAASFADPDTTNTIVRFHTNMGDVDIQLLDGQAPQNVMNFLNYIQDSRYAASFFHRLALNSDGSVFVLQGGGFGFDGTTITPVDTFPNVANEHTAANSNVRGTVSMAQAGTDANSANSQFFFNQNNNAGLDSANTLGFTVFAKVVDGFSQRILDILSSQPVVDESKAAGAAIATVQEVVMQGSPTGGTFTLSLGGTATAPIAFNAGAADVAAALASLPSPLGGTIGTNVSVTGTAGNWRITFNGNLTGTDVTQLVADPTALTGGIVPKVAVSVATHGAPTNGALGELPLKDYSGTNFPSDATPANFEMINSVEIIRSSEELTYSITGNSNPTKVEATLDPLANNRLTLRFLAAGTSNITVTATDRSGVTITSTFLVTIN